MYRQIYQKMDHVGLRDGSVVTRVLVALWKNPGSNPITYSGSQLSVALVPGYLTTFSDSMG